ncbi:MAG: DUF3800 domain-containing protein [Nitrospira sp.]
MKSLGGLSCYIHPQGTSHKLTAMLNLGAYGDESETDGQVFCVSAYVAAQSEWEKLEVSWTIALEELRERYGKPFLEFKMYDCVAGESDYKGLTIPEREAIQRRFIAIINSIQCVGVASAVHLRAFATLSAEEKRRMGPKKYEKPYFLAFGHVIFVAASCLLTMDKREQLAAIFDETKEYQGRAKELWSDLKRQPETITLVPIAPRMGTITHADSKRFPGLQAADILAHEARLHFIHVVFNAVPSTDRWQWKAINERLAINMHPIGLKDLRMIYRLPEP